MAPPGISIRPAISPLRTPRPRRKIDWIQIAEFTFLALLVALGFLARLWPIWKVHWWDEAVYLQDAAYICCGKHNYSELASQPPLLSLLYAGIFLLWNSQYAASLLTAALNAAGPLFLYLAAKRLHGRAAAVIAALLLGFSPFFVQWGNTLLTDCPALTLTVLAFWFVLEAATAPDSLFWPALAGFVTGLAGLMHFPSLMTVLIFPLYLLREGKTLIRVGLFAGGLCLALGPYLLWTWLAYGSPLSALRMAFSNVGGSVEPRLYYLQNFQEVFPWVTLGGVALWLVAWLRDSLITWGREGEEFVVRIARRATAPHLASDAILWGWAALTLLYFSNLPHKELRYILPLAVPLFLLAGRGLAVLARARTLQSRAVGMIILALALVYSFAPLRQRFSMPFLSPYVSEEVEASDYLNQHANPAEWLYANFNYPVFGYYTRMKLSLLRQQDMSFYTAFPENMPEDGYLILYKQIPKEPAVAWAEANPHFRRMKDFPSLVIYEYHRAGF